jgi:hypothetical protein
MKNLFINEKQIIVSDFFASIAQGKNSNENEYLFR